MSDTNAAEWHTELRLLLNQIQARPSEDWTQARERIRVLNALIASHEQRVEA